MSPPAPYHPINLTDASGRMPWSEVGRALRISAHRAGAVLEILGLNQDGQGHPNDGRSDTVYVIVSGYGLLRHGEQALECTGGMCCSCRAATRTISSGWMARSGSGGSRSMPGTSWAEDAGPPGAGIRPRPRASGAAVRGLQGAG
jgi:hypothetical protein